VRVLVVGGTGALGAPVVRALTRAGHEVTVTTRSTRRSAVAQTAGASTAVADLLDPSAFDRAMGLVEPEVVVHAATALPAGGPQRWSQLAATNALRGSGTRQLVESAARHGVRRVVSQSFLAGYAPVTDPNARLAETASFGEPTGARGLRAATVALRELESHTMTSGVEGVVLRFGFFYGDPAGTDALHAALRRRRLPLPGDAPGVVSFVHVDDAAAAVLAATETAAAGQVLNVADDEPATFGDYVRATAASIGAPPPRTVPTALGRLLAPAAVEFICKHRPLDTSQVRAELGWSPRRQRP
jgi:nucleoside-diphosphate-sugar epimerase